VSPYGVESNALGLEENRNFLEAVCGHNVYSEFAPIVTESVAYNDRLDAYTRWMDQYAGSAPRAEPDANAQALMTALGQVAAKDEATLNSMCEAVIQLNGIPEDAYGRVKSLIRLDSTKAAALPPNPNVDIWSALWNAQKDSHEDDLAVLSPRLVVDGKATEAFDAVCNDNGGKHLKAFNDAWTHTESYAAKYEHFTGQSFGLVEPEEAQVLNAFGRVDFTEACNVGRNKYGVSGGDGRNLDGHAYWIDAHKRNIPTNRPEYWFGKIALEQDVGQAGFDALMHAENGLMRAFAVDQADAQKCCKKATAAAEFDIFDSAASLAWKEKQHEVRHAFVMCYMDEHRTMESDGSRNLMPNWSQFAESDTICMNLNELTRHSVVSYEDMKIASITCRDQLENKLSVLFNRKTAEHADADKYCTEYIQSAAEADGKITFGHLAYWATQTDGEHYFSCVEKVVIEAQQSYHDNRLQACAVLQGATAAQLEGLGDAWSTGDGLNMMEVADALVAVNTPLIPSNEHGWLDVTKNDDKTWKVTPITSLQISVNIPDGADVSDMTQSIKAAVQKQIDIGEFDTMTVADNVATFEWSVHDDEIISHAKNIKSFRETGFTIDGKTFTVKNVMIAGGLHQTVAKALEAAELEYDQTQFHCALRADDLTPRRPLDAIEKKETEAPATDPPTDPPKTDAPKTDAPKTNPPVTPAPAETSKSSLLSLAALGAAGIVALY